MLVLTSGVRFSPALCLQVRFYEAVTPLQTQLAELRARKDTLSEELDLHRNQTKALMEVKHADEVFPSDVKLFTMFTVCLYRQLIFKINPQSYEEERRLRSDLEQRSQRLTLELADTKQLIQDGDFRRDNYPNLKR